VLPCCELTPRLDPGGGSHQTDAPAQGGRDLHISGIKVNRRELDPGCRARALGKGTWYLPANQFCHLLVSGITPEIGLFYSKSLQTRERQYLLVIKPFTVQYDR